MILTHEKNVSVLTSCKKSKNLKIATSSYFQKS